MVEKAVKDYEPIASEIFSRFWYPEKSNFNMKKYSYLHIENGNKIVEKNKTTKYREYETSCLEKKRNG